MKLLDRTPGDHEVDQLLRAFYQAELPDPFPALAAPQAKPTPAVRWSVLRSRMALAASVSLLLLGGWLLAGQTADQAPPTLGVGSDMGDAFRFNPLKPALKHTSKPDKCLDCCGGK